MKITKEWLEQRGACIEQVETFAAEWPDGTEIDAASLQRIIQLNLDIDWLASEILPAPAFKAYEAARATSLRAYVEATAPAFKAYEAARAPTWPAPAYRAYVEATAPALRALEDVPVTALLRALTLTGEKPSRRGLKRGVGRDAR